MNIPPSLLDFMAKAMPAQPKQAPGGIGKKLPAKRNPKSNGQEMAEIMGIQKPERFG